MKNVCFRKYFFDKRSSFVLIHNSLFWDRFPNRCHATKSVSDINKSQYWPAFQRNCKKLLKINLAIKAFHFEKKYPKIKDIETQNREVCSVFIAGEIDVPIFGQFPGILGIMAREGLFNNLFAVPVSSITPEIRF